MDTSIKTRETVDIGEAIGFVSKDPDWIKKILTHAIYMFIPIVGPIALLGWERRIFEQVRAGVEGPLPTVDLGSDISYGIPPFVASLNIMVLAFVPWVLMVCAGVFTGVVAGNIGGDAGQAVSALGGILMLGMQLLFMVVILAANIMSPEILRRGFKGEMAPLFKPGASIRAIKNNVSPYIMVVVGMFVAGMAANLGMFLCFIGIFATLPWAMATVANVIGQWDSVVESQG